VAQRPNQKWIADFTYIWTAEGWLYVAAVIDLFSRRVVGWSMKAEMTAQFVTDALLMAIWRRGKPDALERVRVEQAPGRAGKNFDVQPQRPASDVSAIPAQPFHDGLPRVCGPPITGNLCQTRYSWEN